MAAGQWHRAQAPLKAAGQAHILEPLEARSEVLPPPRRQAPLPLPEREHLPTTRREGGAEGALKRTRHSSDSRGTTGVATVQEWPRVRGRTPGWSGHVRAVQKWPQGACTSASHLRALGAGCVAPGRLAPRSAASPAGRGPCAPRPAPRGRFGAGRDAVGAVKGRVLGVGRHAAHDGPGPAPAPLAAVEHLAAEVAVSLHLHDRPHNTQHLCAASRHRRSRRQEQLPVNTTRVRAAAASAP